MKICKAVTTTPPLIPTGTLFTFVVTPVSTGVGVIQTVTVPSGSCTVVGNFAFDSTWSIAEAPAPNVTVTSITAVPTNVVVLEGGVRDQHQSAGVVEHQPRDPVDERDHR